MRLRNAVWIIAALLLPSIACAESSVWRMTGEGRAVVYLAGSVHLLRESDYPLPPEFDAAYGDAEALVLELTPEALAQGGARDVFLRRGTYPAGESIADHLSPQVYRRLESYCAAHHIALEPLKRFRPWLLLMTLTMEEMARQGFDPDDGIDTHLARRAKQDNKPVFGLETVEEQVALLAAFDDRADVLVTDFLDEAERPLPMEAIVRAWRAGDLSRLEALGIGDMRRDDPKLYRALLVDRNHRWLRTIERWAAGKKRVLFVVGAAHLVGEEGLIALLRQRGHRVVQLDAQGPPGEGRQGAVSPAISNE